MIPRTDTRAHLRRGFSLIELTLSVTMIFVLYSICYPHGRAAVDLARDRTVEQRLEACRGALARHLLDHDGRSPSSADELRRYLIANPGDDPLTWTGARGRGRIVYTPEQGLFLIDAAGARVEPPPIPDVDRGTVLSTEWLP